MREDQPVRGRVCALVLAEAHNPYLERVLSGLLAQNLQPSSIIIALRGGHRDLSTSLASFHGDITIHEFSTRLSFAEIVAHVATPEVGKEYPWLWILHGDTYPHPEALDELLRVGERSAKIGAVGAKQVKWGKPKELLEVGIQATRTARRVPLAPDEIDQGQFDWREDVLGVGSAGMLLRLEALEAVGGFDRVLGPFGEGLEFSRRLWAGGWRVLVAPAARLEHARHSYGGDEGRASFAARRRAQMYNASLACPQPLLCALGYFFLAFTRAFLRLATKDIALAGAELRAAARMLTCLGALAQARKRLRKARTVSNSVLRSLETPPSEVRKARRDISRTLRQAHRPRLDPLAERAYHAWRRQTWRCGILVAFLTALISLGAFLPVIGRGALEGGALLPDTTNWSDLLRAGAAWWLPSGSGEAVPTDALWVLLAPFVGIGQLCGYSLGEIASILLITTPLLAGLAAFCGAGALVRSPGLRAGASLIWACAPTLFDAISAGQVAAVLWHILAPLALGNLARCLNGANIGALARASLILTFMCAASPGTLIVVVAMTIIGLLSLRPRLRWLWLPVPSLAVLAPTLLAAARTSGGWKIFLATPGAPMGKSANAVGLLTLRPSSLSLRDLLTPGSQQLWAIATLALFAISLTYLFHRQNWARIRAGFLLLAVGILWAATSNSTATSLIWEGAHARETTAWPGVGLSLALGGIWIVFLRGSEGLVQRLSTHSFGLAHIRSAVGTLVVVFSVAAMGITWVEQMLEERPLRPASASSVPAVARLDEISPFHGRVLALFADESGIRGELWRGSGRQLSEESMLASLAALPASLSSSLTKSEAASQALREAVMGLIAGKDVQIDLARFGVAYILVPPAYGSETARSDLVAELRSRGELEYVSDTQSGAFWRLTNPGGRLRLEESVLASGTISAGVQLPTDSHGGRLELAEMADEGWQARLDGRKLTALSGQWNQTWEVPAGGGMLTVERPLSERASFLVGAIAVSLALLLSLPIRRRRVEV